MKALYHGTIYKFDEIDVPTGKGYKDFGKGFYATAVFSHAERLAIRNKRIAEKRQSFLKNKKGIKLQPVAAYRYNLFFSEDTAGLQVKVFEKADKEWLRFILKNRKCDGCMHDYDIVMDDQSCSRDEAVESLMKTTVYAALMDEDTDLYLESREAVLDILKEELAGNPYRLLDV